jgi:hypothetical protein
MDPDFDEEDSPSNLRKDDVPEADDISEADEWKYENENDDEGKGIFRSMSKNFNAKDRALGVVVAMSYGIAEVEHLSGDGAVLEASIVDDGLSGITEEDYLIPLNSEQTKNSVHAWPPYSDVDAKCFGICPRHFAWLLKASWR